MGTLAHHPGAGGRPVVLVVEDERLVRFTIAETLRDAGFAVVEAPDAAEAVKIVDSVAPVDVVFTDVQMPGAMDGVRLAHWIHEHHPGIPVLLTSGNPEAVRSCGDIPEDAFFKKPFAPQKLVRRIHSLLDERPNLRAG